MSVQVEGIPVAEPETTPDTCPACGSNRIEAFYEAGGVPVNSVLLLDSRREALEFPRGDIALTFCRRCGFIHNAAFDPRKVEYSPRYEETQGFSPTFRDWHWTLATDLVERYDLRDKAIVEIGCGKGEFLTLLCELGNNRGVGFDPAYVPDRNHAAGRDRVRFIQDFYSERYGGHGGDFVCCKMTLEHIGPVESFVRMVRRSLEDDLSTLVFFQVPDVARILRDSAFWDIYYEHCSYFSRGSLARLFRRCGFEVLETDRQYGDQYLTLVARPVRDAPGAPCLEEQDVEQLGHLVNRFGRELGYKRQEWSERLARWKREGRRVVVWGSGSKGVAFLTSLGAGEAVELVVDINPHRHGHFMPGTGQEIVGPARLAEQPPDVVIVMNPIYRGEIVRDLHGRGLDPEVLEP